MKTINTFFKELFDYNRKCNQALIETIIDHQFLLSEKSLSLFSHILNGHHVWNCKIENKKPFYSPWEIHDLSNLKYIDNNNYFDSLLIVDEHDLYCEIQYTTSKGGAFRDTVQDILFNIINHSTYHRGQIAMEFRRTGIKPLFTNYVFFKKKDKQLQS